MLYSLPLYVGIILLQQEELFLIQRSNTNWMQGYWNFPGGLVERDETIMQAAIREAQEEVGITLKPEDLTLIHVLHVHKNETNTQDIIGIYFVVTDIREMPTNNEPSKIHNAQWFNINQLPDNITEHAKMALNGLLNNSTYSEHGWQKKILV